MDIQQKDKESLGAYIHRFTREAKRCNFTNNAATIRIFVKGLQNTHTIATCVCEKGPQTLADTISEVEKLQAVQQLTATLLPSSTVNVMSTKEDQCFQCQELGHITCHWPNVHCFECDEYGHIVADCPDRIPPSGMPTHHHRLNSKNRHCTRSTSRWHHRYRYRHSRLRSQSQPCRYRSYSHHDSHRGHSLSHNRYSGCHHRSTSGCLPQYSLLMPWHTTLKIILAQKFLNSLQRPQQIHMTSLHINPVRKLHLNHHPVLAEQQWNHGIGNSTES